MANFYAELADYMEDQDPTLDDLFTGIAPPSPINLIALVGLPSPVIGAQRDIPGLTFPRFQVFVRNSDFNTGMDQMTKVRTVLHGLIGIELDSWRIMRLHSDQDGGPIGQDDKGNFEFSINFTGEIHAI